MGSLLVAGLMIGLLGMFVASGISNTRRKKMAKTRIADCRPGQQVKLVGKVVALPSVQAVKAPVSGRDCVGYHAIATLGRRVVTKSLVMGFVVDDGSGQATIEATGDRKLVLDLEYDDSSRYLDPFTVEEVPGLAQFGMSKADKLTEGLVMPGMRVAVFGEIASVAAGHKVRLGPPAKGFFSVSDKRDIINEFVA